ncbi:uncharacterized protein F4817DRAFT_342250 [Daldinia loculata]|uniref:uncharacterized protein n=1 Tax=Daldinia loculata TaxID=103429 RepID=UPI0020C2DF2A|nr:uncharacterized protein F4817DRAFT_342250 [Daldinia loculata]KAI1645777.1 hypothetical protein F4817DRAFT_342250 [Daldinia loculata]
MASTTPSTSLGLLDLPTDILVMLPEFLHNIEDYVNLSSTCRTLRKCTNAASPNVILHLAHASSRVFFRPDPFFLICATARELGTWARKSDENEAELAAGMPRGADHLMDLALRHCGLTMARIRELHALRFSVINPVSDLIDKCIGDQWYATPNFWYGGVDDAYTIYVDVNETFFNLAIYGELFGPDFDPFFDSETDFSFRRRLKVDTRFEYIKYCLPDVWVACFETVSDLERRVGSYDPRRDIIYHPEGPYARRGMEESRSYFNHTIGLIWLMKSTRWRPHWIKARKAAGAGPEFADNIGDLGIATSSWRQLMLENVMQCQGLEGLGMIREGTEIAERWKPKIREWRDKIERMEEPVTTKVGLDDMYEYPDLFGDLRMCCTGYLLKT